MMKLSMLSVKEFINTQIQRMTQLKQKWVAMPIQMSSVVVFNKKDMHGINKSFC